MRDLRNSLGNDKGGGDFRTAGNGRWKQICADLFQGLDSMHANGMIRGWEALWSDSLDRPNGPVQEVAPSAAEIAENPILRTATASATFYRELGKVKEAVRPVLVERLRKGEMSCTPMAVQKAAALALRSCSRSKSTSPSTPPSPAPYRR
jgi:hypothetical protein